MVTNNARFWQMDARFMQHMQLKAAGLSPEAIDDYVTNMIAEWLNMDSKPLDYTDDGIAIVSISGPLYKRKSPFESNYRSIGEALETLLSQKPSAVVLKIDSPGGMVDGLEAVCQQVDALAQQTLVVAAVQGCCCSAAYRIASQCGTIVATNDSDVGSIGTYWQWIDYSKAFETAGLKSVMLTTGPFKGTGAIGEPITDEQQVFLQELTDKTNQGILSDVRTGRGFSEEQLMAVSDGRFWLASDALSLGLIDSIGSMADVLSAIRSQTKESAAMPKAKLKLSADAEAEAADDVQTDTADAESDASDANDTSDSATESAASSSAASSKGLADYMSAFGDADGAKMFRDGVTWEEAQGQHTASLCRQIDALKGQLQDLAAENAQQKSRIAELSKAMGGESDGLNLGTGDQKQKKSFGDACRAARSK